MVWQENEHPRDNNGQFTSKGGNTNARPNEAKLRNYGIDTREMAKQYIGNDKLQALADKLDVSIDDLSEDELLKYMSDDEIADMMRINGVDFDDDYESDFEEDSNEQVVEYDKPYDFDKWAKENNSEKAKHPGYLDIGSSYDVGSILSYINNDPDWSFSGNGNNTYLLKHKSGPIYLYNADTQQISLITENAATRYEGV